MTSTISLFAALAILVSCNNYKQPASSLLMSHKIENDTANPVLPTISHLAAYPTIFESAFEKGTTVKTGSDKFHFYRLDIGKIKIESGKLIACDPSVMQDASPFTQKFPPGVFPVHLAMAKTHNDERVAFSRIVFSPKAVAKWEFALKNGEIPIPLKDSSYYCYGVDAGAGIFIDSIANKAFSSKYLLSEWARIFVDKAEKNGYKGFIHEFGGHNFATFSTGYGDGCYATYIGFDKDGNACQILTDFELVEW